MVASNLRPAETRIPDHPDQTEFLDRWYEFHQGYRVVTRDDESEHHIAVLGEPFKDVTPGYLPRTIDELRIDRNRGQHPYVQASDSVIRASDNDEQDTAQVDLEDALDQMLVQAETEEAQQGGSQRQRPQETRVTTISRPVVHRSAASSQYQTRRVAALRRELHRLRTGVERVISGLRELGEDVDSWRSNGLANLGRTLDDISTATNPRQTTPPDRQDQPIPPTGSTTFSRNAPIDISQTHGALADLQSRLDQANTRLEEARRAREQAADELEATESEVQASRELVRSLEREQRTAENYIRIFGTREEMERAGAEYESPIGAMFTRAWNRYRVAEEVRREERSLRQVLEGEERVLEVEGPSQAQMTESGPTGNGSNENTPDEGALTEYYATLWMRDRTQGALSDLRTALEAAQHNEVRERMSQAHQEQTSISQNSSFPRAAAQRAWLRHEQHGVVIEDDSSESDPESPQGLDREDDGRPPPKSDEDMTIKLECKICYQQLADTVVLPCGHLVMCEWCAAQHMPSHHADRTRPKRTTDCPLCRKRVKQKV